MPIDPMQRPSLLPIPTQPPLRPMFRTLGIAGSGLSAQRQRMETIAQNIANADVTRGADGKAYRRRDVVMESATANNPMFGQTTTTVGLPAQTDVFGQNPFVVPAIPGGDRANAVEVPVLTNGLDTNTAQSSGAYGVRVAGVVEDSGEGRMVYEPGHPDADANGYVRYPDIDTTQELVKLMDAKRMYEANASVFQTAKSILRASLDI